MEWDFQILQYPNVKELMFILGQKNEFYHSYIDIDLIISGEQKYLPDPQKIDLPDDVKKIVEEKELESGTLVIWSILDRCKWKQSKTIASNTEHLVEGCTENSLMKKRLK